MSVSNVKNIIVGTNDQPKFRLVSTGENDDFGTDRIFAITLKKAIKDLCVKKIALAETINSSPAQISKFCDGRGLPTLSDFRTLCLTLNIDPISLLGLEFVNARDYPEPGVIYDWALLQTSAEQTSLEWFCSLCRGQNISYEINNVKGLDDPTLICEFCGNNFHQLNEASILVRAYERKNKKKSGRN